MAREPEHIQHLRCDLGEQLAVFRQAAALSQDKLGKLTFCDRTTITKVEGGERAKDREFWVQADHLCHAEGTLLAAFDALDAAKHDYEHEERERALVDVRAKADQLRCRSAGLTVARQDGFADLRQVERLRRGLDDVLSEGAMSDAALDDWEQLVVRYGHATRDRPASVLLMDLSVDLSELRRALAQCHSASALRRLTRTAAHLSGLMMLTLVKVDDRTAFRRWARTARIAAVEAGDPVTHSWVLAQEAYGHYYAEDLAEAIAVARGAQAVAPRVPCVGAVLAAALEARAQAVLGRADETRDALRRAETLLAGLEGDALVPSAFGYNEGQLRFHEGNALTHLGDTKRAWVAQERALQLVAPGDYMDRAFTQLDRAVCLAHDGDVAGAASYAVETLIGLTDSQRQGIITLRAQQMVQALPRLRQASTPVRELRDLLMLPTELEG